MSHYSSCTKCGATLFSSYCEDNKKRYCVMCYVEEFGGEGSGNFDHEGRPGEVGGSGEGGDSKEDFKGDPANTRVAIAKIPDKVYVGVHGDWYEGWKGWRGEPIKEKGLKAGKIGQFGHKERRRDSVYVATNAHLAGLYAGLYSNPVVLEVNTKSLNKNNFYYDSLDVSSFDSPRQLAYRGDIPIDAIQKAGKEVILKDL